MTTQCTSAADRSVEDVIRQHLPLVGHMVREMLGKVPGHVNRDDLTSAGLAAITMAAKSFDPERGVPFNRFAASRIRGALLDELRGMDWATRSVRARARQLETTRQALSATLGRTPTVRELAEALGVAVDEVASIEEDVQRAVVLSLQGFAPGTADDMVHEGTPGPEELLLHRERLGYLRQAIDSLPERLRIVVSEYFLAERPMAEIAKTLGVTESRVSQLRSEALTLLRDGLNSQLAPDMLPKAERPDGCIARRRSAYYAQIAAKGDLRTRLAMTDELGAPLSNTA